MLGLGALGAREVHRWLGGIVIVRIENDSSAPLRDLKIILRGDSASFGAVPRGAAVEARLRPTTQGPLLLRSTSFPEDSVLIGIYVEPRSLPGEGRVIVQLLPDTLVVRRQTQDGAAVRPRVREATAPAARNTRYGLGYETWRAAGERSQPRHHAWPRPRLVRCPASVLPYSFRSVPCGVHPEQRLLPPPFTPRRFAARLTAVCLAAACLSAGCTPTVTPAPPPAPAAPAPVVAAPPPVRPTRVLLPARHDTARYDVRSTTVLVRDSAGVPLEETVTLQGQVSFALERAGGSGSGDPAGPLPQPIAPCAAPDAWTASRSPPRRA